MSYLICVFTTINSDNIKEIKFQILETKQHIHLYEKYDELVIYKPEDLELTHYLCKKILELENEIEIFYYAHPYRLDKFEQNKVDFMELTLNQLNLIVKNKIDYV